MRILITICARGGSKGVPDKNIRPLAGQPLLAYTIDTAQRWRAQLSDAEVEVILSTDSEKIKAVARECGLATDYTRPAELATDQAGKIGAIAAALHHAEAERAVIYDYVLDLDVTAPLRSLDDLHQSLQRMEAQPEALNLFSVSPPHRNPYFNMVELREDGYAQLVKPPRGQVLSRQAAPPVYDMNASFYFFRRRFFELGHESAITDRSLVHLMDHICFDIDHPLDYEIMDFLVREDKLDFSL